MFSKSSSCREEPRTGSAAIALVFAARYTADYFVKVNAIGGAATALAPLGLFDYRGGYTFGGAHACLLLTAMLLFNAWYRLRVAIATKSYSPGLVSGLALYLPLAVAIWAAFLRAHVVGPASVALCLAGGALLQPAPDARHERALKRRAPVTEPLH
jgi:hypothetical protein